MRWLSCAVLLFAVSVQGQGVAPTADSVTVVRLDSTTRPSPRSLLCRSALIPGWGQLATGHPVKAVFFASAGAAWLSAAIAEAARVDEAPTATQRQDRAARRNTRVLYYVITATLAGLDAYVNAHLDDFDMDADPFATIGARFTIRF